MRMSTRTHSWNAYDYAASQVARELLEELHTTYRAISEMSAGRLKYGRIYDIAQGAKAPIKVSELFTLCELTGRDVAACARDVMVRAKNIRQRIRGEGLSEAEHLEADIAEAMERLKNGGIGIAASRDPNKEKEMKEDY